MKKVDISIIFYCLQITREGEGLNLKRVGLVDKKRCKIYAMFLIIKFLQKKKSFIFKNIFYKKFSYDKNFKNILKSE